MNKANLKSYAPKARLDFIKAVTERANVLGISAAGVVPAEVRGDVALIDGREWPAKVAGQRDELIARIKRHGFEQTMDEVAYTWFNRFAALRYMEIHDYLGHGWRVLSSRDGGLPEILRHASEVTLPGLNPGHAREMQLAGNQDNELYKLLLVAQCNELSRVMPFLFERIDDDTELLLPENLLRTDSIVAKLVEQVPEEDWLEIEVIGWLYQFYISEKKDEVIGKVVRSEDIPAATQQFTPNWIVQYLVQNTLGRLWLMANPSSTLPSQWTHYIHPAEQPPEVRAQLDSLIQMRVGGVGGMLNPETITVLDPACGSGHILVVAYDVLKAIYLERGYQPRAIPRLILEKNLFGLDIDDRAAQLAAFALLMKARADDRRLFTEAPKLNVVSLLESKGLDIGEITTHLAQFGLQRTSTSALVEVFEGAKTFGSLIRIPPPLRQELTGMANGLEKALGDGDLYAQQAAKDLLPLVLQALMLCMRFDATIANPPYMGGKFFNPNLKEMINSQYESAKGDLYASFLTRNLEFAADGGLIGMITIPNWMFLSGFEDLRRSVFMESTIETFCHNGRGVFGSDFGSCSFTIRNMCQSDYKGTYKRLFDKQGSVATNEELNARFFGTAPFLVSVNQFLKVPGIPLAYWVSDRIRNVFENSAPLSDRLLTRLGMSTADNERFLRYWHEVDVFKVAFQAVDASDLSGVQKKWFPYQKGGLFRKWYGNHAYVVNWERDGAEVRGNIDASGRIRSHNYNGEYGLREGITWSDVTSGANAFRYMPKGFLFDGRGSAGFSESSESLAVSLGLLNSKVSFQCIAAINPTIAINVGEIGRIPFHKAVDSVASAVSAIVRRTTELAKADWDSLETSWDFKSVEWARPSGLAQGSVASSWASWKGVLDERRHEMKALEDENNLLLIRAYGLESEFSPDVQEDEITLARADREKDSQRLISYAVGCMMGRYSLREPGLIYAHTGGLGFDSERYGSAFPADADGIIPLTDHRWFEDDAASRVGEFLRAVWGTDAQEENMDWLAGSLGAKSSEAPDEAIRRYLAEKFFKDHLQTYKKRPIYWLFGSGKQGAFQALVYLHRYNEGTLARMRAEYVVPLIAKMASRVDMLDKDVGAASSAAARTKLQKQIEALRKKQIELLAYDEKLRHYADMRIALDLDDGVKVNYAKFGDLLAEAKAICGGKDED
ncbi:BREX-1 system adenine-specific DNA-methyltransferase PglX [Roseateles sp.]|uniref:BREX-1 system adenine-specific DNA-methyltransferase PglX n=1 Tax=Roseateles sp. TaxID=1971397 RepID=UPI003BA41960